MTFSQKSILHSLFLLFLGMVIGLVSEQYVSAWIYVTPQNPVIVSQSGATKQLSNNAIFATEKIRKTMDIIRMYSYGFSQKKNTDIEDAMLDAIVKGLGDKHSTYFTKKETESFEESLRGDFEGIGAVIGEDPRGIKIIKIIPGSPAEKSGLLAGDILLKVGETQLVGKSTEEAVKVIRGPKGTTASITYRRGNENKDLLVNVKRDRVNVPSVASKIIDKNIGYIEVSTFGEHTSEEFVKAWNTVIGSGSQGIILDFRNNGGGYLNTAVDLASMVLPKNSPVVIIKQNAPQKNEVLLTRNEIQGNTKIPLVVLINDYSASASEIFAGALKDHGRALIVGEKSYGKGSVQEPFDLGDGSIIKITTARWYTPKDISIDEKGIVPDINVLLTNKDFQDVFDRQLKAAEMIMKNQTTDKLSVSGALEKYKTFDFTSLKK